MNKNDIAKALTELRKELNLSQKEVANALFMNPSTLNKIEKGTRNITVPELLTLLNFYNVPLQSVKELIHNKTTNSKIESLDNSYNRIVSHYQKYKDTNLKLIQNDLDTFQEFFYEANNLVKFDMKHNIQWFTQLTFMFPLYFPQENKKILEKYIEAILARQNWLESDYLAIFNCIPHLQPSIVNKIYKKVIINDFERLKHNHRRYFEMILENLSDYFLTHYSHKEIKNPENKLNELFEKWNTYIHKYNPIENKIIYNHNYSMYLMLFEKLDKEIVYNECLKRNEALKTLGLSNIADPLLTEAKSYKNNTNGNLNIIIFNT